jgi:hypothetical protein
LNFYTLFFSTLLIFFEFDTSLVCLSLSHVSCLKDAHAKKQNLSHIHRLSRRLYLYSLRHVLARVRSLRKFSLGYLGRRLRARGSQLTFSLLEFVPNLFWERFYACLGSRAGVSGNMNPPPHPPPPRWCIRWRRHFSTLYCFMPFCFTG